MKNILKVTILFCIIISCFIVPSFADTWVKSSDVIDDKVVILNNPYDCYPMTHDTSGNQRYWYVGVGTDNSVNLPAYLFCLSSGAYTSFVYVQNNPTSLGYYSGWGPSPDNPPNLSYAGSVYTNHTTVDDVTFTWNNTGSYGGTYYPTLTTFNSVSAGLQFIADYINNPPAPTPSYTKNPNVDEFIANTLISMGVKFDTPAYAISYAADAWVWCIDETNMETANPFDEWNIDSFVSYCNAQSNNYLNWYNGYKVSKDVTNALGEYIRQNIRSLTSLPAGVTSVTGAYLPIYHYGSGFQSGVSSPTAQTFYAAQTITYFNGEYVNETDDISTSQFLYTPADVRRFLGYPGTSPVISPSSPTGTGTITDDPNNPDQKNISINFPSLDWLADAIKSILDFLRDAFTTLANLLTQLLDAILGLFSDAFESLQDFGQGIIEFIQSVFSGLSDLLSGYVPSDISVIIVTFIALNFGIGLITFVLKGH